MFRKVKTKEEYAELSREYKKQKDRIKTIFLNKKLSRSDLADDILEFQKATQLANIRQQELNKTQNLIVKEPEPIKSLEEKPEPIKSLDEEEEPIRRPKRDDIPYKRMELTKRPGNQGDKYLFYEGNDVILELNINNKNQITSETKYKKLINLDPVYWMGQSTKNEFLKNVKFVPLSLKRTPQPPSSPREREMKITRPKMRKVKSEDFKGEGIKSKMTELKKLNLLVGSYMSGNDNKKLKKDIVNHLNKLHKGKILTKSQKDMIMNKL